MVEIFLAKRFLQSYRSSGFLSFIASFTILGIILGTAALIITLAILDGFEKEIKEKIISFNSHIQIQDFQKRPLKNPEQLIKKLEDSIAGISVVIPFLQQESIIRFREQTDGLLLKGTDLHAMENIFKRYLIEGSIVPGSNLRNEPIIIGKKLAERLDVRIGDNVVIFGLSQRMQESFQPRALRFSVIGIYESGMSEYDEIFGFTSLTANQRLFQLENAVNGYEIWVNDISNVDIIARRIQDFLGYPYYARTVFQSYRDIFEWVKLQKQLSPILLSLIVIVATVNIIGTILMYILEKTKAIGILKSMGAKRSTVRRIFMIQGITLAVVGIALGNILAYGLCWIQVKYKIFTIPSEIYLMSTVPVSLNIEHHLIVSIITFILCFFTTYLTSQSATRINPVSAIRFG